MLSFLFWHFFFLYHQTKVAKFCCKLLVLQSPMLLGCHCVQVVRCVDVCPSEQHFCLLALKAREYLSAAPSRPLAPGGNTSLCLFPGQKEAPCQDPSVAGDMHTLCESHGRMVDFYYVRPGVWSANPRSGGPPPGCKINKELCLCLRAKRKIRGQGCFCLICNPMAALPLSCSRAHFSDTSDRWLNQVSWV